MNVKFIYEVYLRSGASDDIDYDVITGITNDGPFLPLCPDAVVYLEKRFRKKN